MLLPDPLRRPHLRSPFALKRAPALAIVLPLLTPAALFADGAIESPPSRNWLCGGVTKPDHFQSGTAQTPECEEAFETLPMAGYNFMSVVTNDKGRAEVTPLPNHVCSFDSKTWQGALTPWDTPMQWPTTPMEPGARTFMWNGSWGLHADDTRDFSFWITKTGFVFDPTRELTWDDFEEASFCTELYDHQQSTANPNIVLDAEKQTFTIRCDVPARSGHHVVYAEWGRTESTWQRFHGCVDLAFGSTALGGGHSRDSRNLRPGAAGAGRLSGRNTVMPFDAHGYPTGSLRDDL